MPKIGTCDVCEAAEVELAYVNCCGIETWACEECCTQRLLRTKPDRRRPAHIDDPDYLDGDYEKWGPRRSYTWGE